MDSANATFVSIFSPALLKDYETLPKKGKDQLLDQGA
jgi:hypothetical protein